MKSNKITTIVSLTGQTANQVATFENDLSPVENMAEHLRVNFEPNLTLSEIVHKYQLSAEPMANGLDLCVWCSKYELAAIQRLNK